MGFSIIDPAVGPYDTAAAIRREQREVRGLPPSQGRVFALAQLADWLETAEGREAGNLEAVQARQLDRVEKARGGV